MKRDYGYLCGYGYIGYNPEKGKTQMFATESEFEEYIQELEDRDDPVNKKEEK